ncbi:bifunctional phosphopantothenoylcysteine decarboxylase/phosphopantothenate--cysteine ligase CoaBC [Lactobacillaceae bacterium Scapto_B20]
MLKNLNIALYVTGSVAAYKSLHFTRLLTKKGANVRVLMTDGARSFVQPLSFEALSKNPVITCQSPGMRDGHVTHIELAQWSDVAIVMPADANTIAKVANGIADNEVTTTLLATDAPKIIVPAMNDRMLSNPATQRNLATLKQDGVVIVDPVVGMLAEGYRAKGRMADSETVLSHLAGLFDQRDDQEDVEQPLAHKKVLVTAGGTRQPLDPIRFITNSSSGRMGIAIAKAAQQLGATVTLICADVSVAIPDRMNVIRVQTTDELLDAVLTNLPDYDVLVMAAAVADFAPLQINDQKIKKETKAATFSIEFQSAPDILKSVAKIKRPDQYIVGFAAETNDISQNAQRKLVNKQLNMLVANDVSDSKIGFNSDDNQVTFLRPAQKPIQTAVLPKKAIAQQLMEIVASELD